MRLFAVSFIAACTLLTAACATTEHVPGDPNKNGTSNSETVPAATDAAAFCGALCDRQNQCDTSLDTQTCKNSCTNATAAVFPRLRSDVVELIVTCFDDKDCKSVLAGNVVGTCASEAVARVAPTDAAVGYCDALSSAKQKCGTTTSKATCLDSAKLYSDDAIGQAQNCAARACTEIDSCVSAVFGSFGTTTSTGKTPPSSGGSCSGQFPDLGSCESCAESSCCSEASACAADSMCRAILDACATSSTPSTTCNSYLSSASSSTQSLVGAYWSCAQSNCSASCGGPG